MDRSQLIEMHGWRNLRWRKQRRCQLDDGHIDLPRSNLSDGSSAEKVSDKQSIHDTIAIKLFDNIANNDIDI